MNETVLSAPSQSLTELAGVLVRISRECESPIEHLRAEQLIRDAHRTWTGNEADNWSKWLAEACRCLNLRATEIEVHLEQALRLAEDGAVVVGLWQPGTGPTVLVGRDEVAEGEIDSSRSASSRELIESARESPKPELWLVVEHSEGFDKVSSSRFVHRPIQRLIQILRPEWNDIWLVFVFAFFSGLLSLSTPIAVEALVNTVAFGRLLQPVVVLAALLFGFLAFAGAMQAMQTYVAEVIQRKLFARVSADLAFRLPSIDTAKLGGAYAPELANRFLDIVTLQKVVAQLLLGGVNIVLATLVGMAVLAFYHPWLLGFDVILLGLVIGGLFILGRGAIRTGIDESKYKYRLTAWFEDLTRCRTAFKPDGGAEFAADRANLIATSYLRHRRSHFTVLFRQILFVLGLQAIAGTVLLGGGGWLVIQGQLSLGQLVAAELIVSIILASMAKIGKHLEGFYDLVAAVDKMGVLFDLPLERHDGLMAIDHRNEGLAVSLTNVRVENAIGLADQGVNINIAKGERVAFYGSSRSGKSAICGLLYAAERPKTGRVTVADIAPTDLRPDVLRGAVALASIPEIFEGTLADNVHLRRREVGTAECLSALEAVGLLDDCLSLPDGLDTPLTGSGYPLSEGQQRLLMIARAIAADPRLLVLDGILDALADEELDEVLEEILNPDRLCTVVVATGRRDIAERMERVLELTNAPKNSFSEMNHERSEL